VRTVEQPLINCYVFVKIAKPEYVPVLETEHVAGFIRFNQNLIAIPEAEMEVLRRITLESDIEVQAVPGYFGEGDLVEIAKGNLTGLKGRIARVEGKHQLVVELTHIGYALLLTVDSTFLQKV
jgi:transcription antitermination factor NusG